LQKNNNGSVFAEKKVSREWR